MWDPLPSDGSVVCQSRNVQTTIGYVQGGMPWLSEKNTLALGWLLSGFNTNIDLYLAGISAFELWQFFIQTLQRNPGASVWAQFRKINPNIRSRRIWQTLTLSGYISSWINHNQITNRANRPLILSGVASIVKTYVSVCIQRLLESH